MKYIPFLALLLTVVASCDKPEARTQQTDQEQDPETLVRDYSDDEMDQAIATARSRIDEFLEVLGEGNADSFSVKAPITDENGTEHFWLTDVSYNDGVFTGLVGNDPGIVENVEFGESWKIERDQISDWMYTRGEMIHGGFTIDPLLSSYPEDQAEALRAKLVR